MYNLKAAKTICFYLGQVSCGMEVGDETEQRTGFMNHDGAKKESNWLVMLSHCWCSIRISSNHYVIDLLGMLLRFSEQYFCAEEYSNEGWSWAKQEFCSMTGGACIVKWDMLSTEVKGEVTITRPGAR